MRRHSWVLLALFFLAFAVRLAYWERSASFGKYELSYDDDEYFQLAVLFAHGEFFQDPYPLRYTRAPGYPLFLAPIFAAFGTEIEIALFFQVGVSMLTVALTYVSARRAFGMRAGLCAMALMALAPLFASMAGSSVLTETLFAFAVLLFLYVLWRWSEEGMTLGRALGAGLVLGYAALVRPMALYFLFFAAAWFLLQHRARWKWALPRAVFLAFGMFVLILPYTARNLITYDRFLLIDSTGGFNIWRFHGAPGDDFWGTVNAIPNPAERDNYAMRRGIENILADPIHQIGTQGAANLADMMHLELDLFARGAGYLSDVMVDAPTLPLVLWDDASYLFLVIFGIAGILGHWQRGHVFARTPLLWWLGFYMMVIALQHAQSRYRAQYAFILILFAGAALAHGFSLWRKMSPRARVTWLAATACICALAYSPLLPPLFASEFYLWQAHTRDVEKIQQAIIAFPLYVRARDELGDAYRGAGNFENALAAYDAALELNPYEIQARLGKIDTLRRMGKPDKIAPELRAAEAERGAYEIPAPLFQAFDPAPTRLIELGDPNSSFGYTLNFFGIERDGAEMMRFTRARSFVKFTGVAAWKPTALFFYARAVPLPNRQLPIVNVRVNGQSIADVALESDWRDHEIPLDDALRTQETLVAEFRVPTFRPRDVLENSIDTRELGFMMGYVELR